MVGVLTIISTMVNIPVMSLARRITANLPESLLEDAMEVTGEGITNTIIAGLEMVRRRRAYTKAMALRGKIDLAIDLEESRERGHR